MKRLIPFSMTHRRVLILSTLLAGISLTSTNASEVVPVPWNGIDIGAPHQAGSSRAENGTFSLVGGGKIGGASDQFHFVYQSLTGDFTLIAHVVSQTGAGDSSQAGLMVRDALAATSNFVALVLTPAHSATLQYRTPCIPRAAADTVNAPAAAWLKLVKRGNLVNGYAAPDKNNAPSAWKRVGAAQPIASGMIYLGVCAAGHQPGIPCTALFDHLSLSTGPQPLLDNGAYTLSPVSAPSLVLEAAGSGASDGTPVTIATPGDSPNQRWVFTGKGQGLYDIHPSYNLSLSLSVAGANTANGTRVALETDRGASSQLWSVVKNPNDTYSLLPQCAPGSGLDDFGGNMKPGFPQDIWQYNNSDPHLQWTISD